MWDKIVSVSEGDTLCNVMLGGCDENGKDQTNELSMLMLETIISRQRGEPHINVRIHKIHRLNLLIKHLRLSDKVKVRAPYTLMIFKFQVW